MLNAQFVSKIALLCLVVVLAGVAAACTSAASPTATSVPTVTPTALSTATAVPTATRVPALLPYPTAAPLPTTPEPMRVVYVDGFDEPIGGTVFEDLLALLPDNDTTRTQASLVDFAGIIDYYAIESPPPGADDETTLAFIEHQYSGEFGGFPARFPYWPYGQLDYIPQINWYPYVGFDIWSVDQFAYAGVQFSRANSGDLRTYDVALGQFSRGSTAGALATCDCDQPDIRTYGETDYYVWGTEGIGVIKKRNSPPLYDHLGRGPRLLVEDGRAFWTVFDAEMEDLIDVLAGAASSLADDPAYVEAVRLSASLGLIRDMSISSRNLSLAEAVASSWADGIETVAQKAPLLKPFGIVAVSSGFDGERPFFGIVIGGHEDAASAVENSKTLLDRLSKVPKGGPNDAPWSELLELVEISVQGDFVVARMYYRDPLMRSGYTADGFLLFNTLFIHE